MRTARTLSFDDSEKWVVLFVGENVLALRREIGRGQVPDHGVADIERSDEQLRLLLLYSICGML